jgi:hypothetical protein
VTAHNPPGDQDHGGGSREDQGTGDLTGPPPSAQPDPVSHRPLAQISRIRLAVGLAREKVA